MNDVFFSLKHAFFRLTQNLPDFSLDLVHAWKIFSFQIKHPTSKVKLSWHNCARPAGINVIQAKSETIKSRKALKQLFGKTQWYTVCNIIPQICL